MLKGSSMYYLATQFEEIDTYVYPNSNQINQVPGRKNISLLHLSCNQLPNMVMHEVSRYALLLTLKYISVIKIPVMSSN